MAGKPDLKTEPLPFSYRAIAVKAIDGSTFLCDFSEVLASLLESRESLTMPQVTVCRRLFNRQHLVLSPHPKGQL